MSSSFGPHLQHARESQQMAILLNRIPVKDVAEAVFTLVEVSCVLFRGDAFNNLLDAGDDEVDARSEFVVRRERRPPDPSPNLSFRAASNISVLFDVASALLTVAKWGPMAVAGKTALSNCLLTRQPVGDARLRGLACKRRECRFGPRLFSSCPTIVLEIIKYRFRGS